MPHAHSSSKYRDFEKWIEEEKAKQRTLSELILEGQIFKDKEGNVHSTSWSDLQVDFIKNHYGEPIIRTQQGVIIQYIPKLKTIVVRKKNGQFKSKMGYGRYIKQVEQIRLEQLKKAEQTRVKLRQENKKGREARARARKKVQKLHRKLTRRERRLLR